VPLALVVLAGDPEAIARCIRSLTVADLADKTALYVAGPAEAKQALRALGVSAKVTWIDAQGAAAVNAVASATDGADLVLLDDATEVAGAWLADLVAVARGEPDAATVTPLSNDAAFLSAPRRNVGWPLLPPNLTLSQAASRVRDSAIGLHPRIPTALSHAVFIRRAALQLVGPFDESLPMREALADFCLRCTAAGLAHVVADEVFVAHRGSVDAPPARDWPGAAAKRHPALATAVAETADARHSSLSRALLAVSVALEPMGVTVDARNLSGGVTGSTVHVIELLGALAGREDVRVRAVLPRQVGKDAGQAVERLSNVEWLTEDALGPGDLARTHIVHRPWQVESVADIALLDELGERTVLTHQDLIAYRTPAVFSSVEAWQQYRRTTADALGLAAMVVFFSRVAAADAVADDLVTPERTRVIPLGTCRRHFAPSSPRRPVGLGGHRRPFLLILGNRFRHKNIRFALDLLAALREHEGWDGDLVIAGAEVLHGSSSGDEAAWHLGHPDYRGHVVELAAVDEAEKAWLFQHAAAVAYPSTYEGFGLIPFEAAMAGTPCLFASVSALRETVPMELAVLEPWDAIASARRVARFLCEGPERAALVGELRAVAHPLTWEATGEALVGAFRDALRLPAPPTARLAADLARAEHDYWSVRGSIPNGAWSLVRPDDPLLDATLAYRISAVLRAPGGRPRLTAALLLARLGPGRRRQG
jgi:glycosyltransferase involved in cell wall biosynthesis/GT2 family glycosyltransferase